MLNHDGAEDNPFVFAVFGQDDPADIKDTYYNKLWRILGNGKLIIAVDNGRTGTHSFRKLAIDIRHGNGCTRNDMDYRARWKGDRRQQDD